MIPTNARQPGQGFTMRLEQGRDQDRMIYIGKRIRLARRLANLEHETVVERINEIGAAVGENIGRQGFSHYESGRRRPSVIMIELIAQVLEVPVAFFYGVDPALAEGEVLRVSGVQMVGPDGLTRDVAISGYTLGASGKQKQTQGIGKQELEEVNARLGKLEAMLKELLYVNTKGLSI
jgi:transcriptional regulator with XRE-family HTH domain